MGVPHRPSWTSSGISRLAWNRFELFPPDLPGPLQALYRTRPADGKVEVRPLVWWNEGDFDFSYQWITRVAREPATGNLFGDGFRIELFIMNPDGGLVGWVYRQGQARV